MYCVCTLPSAVFALWAMLIYASLAHFLVTEMELIVSLTWIVLLLLNPIRIRSSVHATKLLILSTMEIWEEYNEKVSDVARLFLTHLNEDQLGISIWGFVMITKPLILSVSFFGGEKRGILWEKNLQGKFERKTVYREFEAENHIEIFE